MTDVTKDFFRGTDGKKRSMDLDEVVRVLRGWSGMRSGWQAYVVFVPRWDCFVELLSTPPDVRGNSREDAIEVPDDYMVRVFGLSIEQVGLIRSHPKAWQFLEMRD